MNVGRSRWLLSSKSTPATMLARSSHHDSAGECPLCPIIKQRLAPDFRFGSKADIAWIKRDVRFSNRPVGVKRFQTHHDCDVDVTCGLALLFGLGTKALPSWDSRTGWNNLYRGLAVVFGRSKRTCELTSFHVAAPKNSDFGWLSK
jgi:hypothetical protein